MGSAMPGGRSTIGRFALLAALALLAGCAVVPPAPPSPPPPPPSPPPPPPSLPPVVAAPEKAWDVAPLTPGNWRYFQEDRTRAASFGANKTEDIAMILCDVTTRQLSLLVGGRAGQPLQTVTIRTSFGDLSWQGSGTPSAAHGPTGLLVTRAATDRGFDWIAYSRGRIAVEVQGAPRLVLPVWAEVSRVIEDCRG